MDNQRIILFFALSFVLLLIWQAWQEDFPASPSATTAVTEGVETARPADVPSAVNGARDTAKTTEMAVATPKISDNKLETAGRVHVVTDTLDVDIDLRGGDLREVDLIEYPVDLSKEKTPFRLLQDSESHILIAQSGLLSANGAPDHHAIYKADQTSYRLADGQNQLKVDLHWQNDQGIQVIKTFTFTRNSYEVGVEHKVINDSAKVWQGHQYEQLQRTRPGADEKSTFINTYTGGVIYSSEEKYEKYSFDDMDDKDLSRDITSGWAAMIQHYFVTAWLPPSDQTFKYYSKAPDNRPYVLGMVSPALKIAPGQSGSFKNNIYIGPKEQKRLEKITPSLKLTVDYGILTILAQPLFWLLTHLHKLFNNWGWSIIVLTLIIKLVFYKLSATSYRSMANMRKLAPRVATIRERYGDDRQRMSQAMMELYKKEKINPLGGCLPMIVQIPVFISLYWVLLESVEMRQAPFIGWIHDLSIKDPYYVLPLLMGVSMFIQQRLNPPPPDPVQAKVMMALPFIFTLFFAFFPAGLVLYWVANSVTSILQQWIITRNIEKAAHKPST
jgi:YidC/Oxa1 family membrane protein insertase